MWCEADLQSTADKSNYKHDTKNYGLMKCFLFFSPQHKRKEFNLSRLERGIHLSECEQREKMQRNTFQAHFCLSGSVNAVCCCHCLLYGAWADQGLLPHRYLWWQRCEDCVSDAHVYSHTQIKESPHIEYKHGKWLHGNKDTHARTHKNLTCCISVFRLLFLLLLVAMLLHDGFCFKI